MNTIAALIHLVGRFAVGIGSGLALICAVVIVTTDIEPTVHVPPPVLVGLDPVLVRIATGRLGVIKAEDQGPPSVPRARTTGRAKVDRSGGDDSDGHALTPR